MDTEMILKRLADECSVSGFESGICETVKELMLPFCDSVKINRFNSVICHKKSGNGNGKKVMIEAHLDQIGMIVTGIDEMGFVKFMSVGGIDKRILPCLEVCILGNERVYGVIGSKPPHIAEKSDKNKMPDIGELLIDTGYSKDELKDKISVGDSIVLKSSLTKLAGETVCSSALDNRAGITAIISAAAQIEKTEYDIYYVFASEEELGLHGAYPASREIAPDYAIIVDVTHGMTEDTKSETGVFSLGCGAVVCKGPALNPDLSKRLIDIAKENGIKYETEVVSGHSGTNAWAVQKSRGNCKTALVSIPLKYMHTAVETVDISDINEVSKLVADALKEGLENA